MRGFVILFTLVLLLFLWSPAIAGNCACDGKCTLSVPVTVGIAAAGRSVSTVEKAIVKTKSVAVSPFVVATKMKLNHNTLKRETHKVVKGVRLLCHPLALLRR